MGRPPIHAAPMSKREIDARHRRTVGHRLAAAYEAVLDAMKLMAQLDPDWVSRHADVIARAYAAQKKGE